VVAPTSRAVADVRVPTQDDAERIEQQIRELEPATPGITLRVEGHFGRPPLERTPRNRLLWHRAQEAAERLGLTLGEAQAGGASDGNETSVFTATLDGLGPVGDGAHAEHEFVFIDQLIERTALLVLLLMGTPVGDAAPHTAEASATTS
jgi:glutamate carboxypeptidase